MGEEQSAGAARARRLRELIGRLKGGSGAVPPHAAGDEEGATGEGVASPDEASAGEPTADEGLDPPMSPRDWINKRMREESLKPSEAEPAAEPEPADPAEQGADQTSSETSGESETDEAVEDPD